MSDALPSWIGSRDEAPHLAALRSAGLAALAEKGLPTRKTEAFRFTSVRDLLETPFVRAEGEADAASVARRLGADETYRIVIANGTPMLTGSTRDGVRVSTLTHGLETHRDAIEGALGRIVPTQHFAAANAASAEDAVVVVVPAGVEASVPVHLVHVATTEGAPIVSYPRVLVLVEPGARATLVETYLGESKGRSFLDAVVEIRLGEGASLDHLLLVESQGSTILAVGVEAHDDASYRVRSALVGGALTRLDHHVALVGARASTDLAGVTSARGSELVDHHVHVDHRGPNGRSAQRFRGLADERGTSIFDGIVNVRAGAVGCEITQESKNLLLSADAAVYAKPHLEIDVDEVVASHGTTVGSFDRDQLFYLQARGIDPEHARALLTQAFVRTVLDDVAVPAMQRRLTQALLSRLPHGELALEDLS